jgi:hypothetical protein
VTLTLPPLCWLQPAPKLREEFLAEGAKVSISKVGIVIMEKHGEGINFFYSQDLMFMASTTTNRLRIARDRSCGADIN